MNTQTKSRSLSFRELSSFEAFLVLFSIYMCGTVVPDVEGTKQKNKIRTEKRNCSRQKTRAVVARS